MPAHLDAKEVSNTITLTPVDEPDRVDINQLEILLLGGVDHIPAEVVKNLIVDVRKHKRRAELEHEKCVRTLNALCTVLDYVDYTTETLKPKRAAKRIRKELEMVWYPMLSKLQLTFKERVQEPVNHYNQPWRALLEKLDRTRVFGRATD